MDTGKIAVFYHHVLRSKDADGMPNSVDPDQTVPYDHYGKCLYMVRVSIYTKHFNDHNVS